MRQARKFVMKKSYEKAAESYLIIVQSESMQGSVDMWLRLAWCYEQMEAWDDAYATYEHVAQMHTDQGDSNSAQDLHEKMEFILSHLNEVQAEEADELEEPIQNEATDSIVPTETAMDFSDLLMRLKGMGDEVYLAEGEVLCEAGAPSYFLWLLEEGELSIQLPEYLQDGEDVLTASDGCSVLLGELGFFTRQRRTAKVWAKQWCRLYQVQISDVDACQDASFNLGMRELLKHYWMHPILSKHTIFERMNDIDRRALCDFFTPIDVLAGTCLMTYGDDHDGAYLLQRGCLFFMYQSETGEEQVSSMFPGDIVHLGGLLHAYQANYEVRTATDVRLLHLSRQDMDEFIRNRPWMVDALLRYSRREAWRQVMHPDDAYLWMTDRSIQQRRVTLTKDA